ncbi:MAG: stage III sporulation protein AF [Oscillospiraceae bacterium]
MEIIRTWAWSVCGVIIFGSICEMLVPNGSLKKYTRLALGLMLILTLAEPLGKFIHYDIDFNEFHDAQTSAYLTTAQMEERQKTDVIRLYKQNISNKISASIGDYDMEVRAEVEVEDMNHFCELTGLTVIVNVTDTNADITNRVKQVAKAYGIPENSAIVKYIKK